MARVNSAPSTVAITIDQTVYRCPCVPRHIGGFIPVVILLPVTVNNSSTYSLSLAGKGRTIIFLEGEGGIRNLKKNCLQSLKRQNKLFAQLQNKNKMFAITLIFASILSLMSM